MHPGFPTLNLILLFLSYPQVFIYSKCIHSLFSFNKNTLRKKALSVDRKLYVQLVQKHRLLAVRVWSPNHLTNRKMPCLYCLLCVFIQFLSLGIILYINDIMVNCCQLFTSTSFSTKIAKTLYPLSSLYPPSCINSCLIFSPYVQNHISVKIVLLKSNII